MNEEASVVEKGTRFRGSVTPVRVALFAILLVSFIMSNYTNLTGSNWVIHPDDHEAYILGRHLWETGRLSIDDPMNKKFKYPVFTPAGASFYGGKVVPTRALGIYFLAAGGFLLGDQGPFYLVPLLGLLALIFFFKLVELVLDEKKALLATFLLAMSAPFLYWNNMLFSNIPALAFFIMGLYFLMRIACGSEVRLGSYLLAGLFFGLAVWMRYEMFAVIVLLFPIVIGRRSAFRLKRLAVMLLVVAIVLAPVGFLNSRLYGNALGVGYTRGSSTEANTAGKNAAQGTGKTVSGLYSRFLKNYFSPNLQTVYNNAYQYLFKPFQLLLLAGLLGLLAAFLDRRQNHAFAFAMLLLGIVWTYYVLNASLHGGSSGSLESSYFRYLLPVYAILAIFAPLFLERLGSVIGKGPYRAILAFFVILFLLTQIGFLALDSFGLKRTTDIKADYKRVNDFFAEEPHKAVVVASLYSKAITSRPVFDTSNITASETNELTVDYIRDLLDKGYEVFLIEASAHAPTFRDLSSFIANRNTGLEVQTAYTLYMRTAIDNVQRVVNVAK